MPNDSFTIKGVSQPTQSYKDIESSTNSEMNINGQIGVTNAITVGVKKGRNTKVLLNKWELDKSCSSEGERWKYTCDNNNFDKSESFVSNEVHSGEWYILEGMHGFYITITQVLDYKLKNTRRLLSNKKIELYPCPKMTHCLKVTFNDLEDFNINLEKLNQKPYCNNRDDINITIGGNETKKNKTEYVQHLNGSIERSFKPFNENDK